MLNPLQSKKHFLTKLTLNLKDITILIQHVIGQLFLIDRIYSISLKTVQQISKRKSNLNLLLNK